MENIPSSLTEAIEILTEHNIEHIEEIKTMTETEFLDETHHSMGRSLRNGWGLWLDETPISKWFIDMGITHGDDKSGIILTSFHRSLMGRELKVDEQVEGYKNHWKKNGFPDGIPK
jgi:hypothetical protein